MLLSSWKEVAEYVGRTVQTVRLWHYYKFPLRVTRSSPSKHARIITTKKAVDEWLYILSHKGSNYWKRKYQKQEK